MLGFYHGILQIALRFPGFMFWSIPSPADQVGLGPLARLSPMVQYGCYFKLLLTFQKDCVTTLVYLSRIYDT